MTLLVPPPAGYPSDAVPQDLAPGSRASLGGPDAPRTGTSTGTDGSGRPGSSGQPRFALLANLPTGRKLFVLVVACVLPTFILAGTVLQGLSTLSDWRLDAEALGDASAELYHLDNRNSEIKADGFRALIGADAGAVVTDTADDIASAEEVFDTLLALDLPEDIRDEIAAARTVADDFYAYVAEFVEAPNAGARTDAEGETALVEQNHELDESLEALRVHVADALADSEVVLADTERTQRTTLLAVLIGAVVIAAGLAFVITRLITRPLSRTVRVLDAVAAGRLDERLEVTSRDEIGKMGVALNTALGTLTQAMSQMDHNAQSLASASEELSSVSGEMSASASESSNQAGLVSAAAEQVSHNVQTVATGTEEMSASIREIAQNASNAAGVAAKAVGVAQSTNATVAKLGDSSAEVGNVIKVINSIAEQTNMLALNATIEAARAGEAGKGFAVVANEVKELAQETGKATEDIGRRIETIQTDTEAAVAAIAEISEIIGQINDTQATIASAVEEQTATTNEMSRNVFEAATGSTDIAQNVTGVARAAADTQAAANSTSQAADELARMAAQMRSLVAQFRF